MKRLSGRRLLLVEDEPLIAALLRQTVESAGATAVGPAATLDAAQHLAATEELDGAILDVNLRGQMSFPAALTLARRGIPFVFVTGYARDAIPATLAHVPILTKPYHMDELANALDAIVERTHHQDA